MFCSVLIPCYNAEASVGAAIESALAQECPVEVIVVDDGSTDGGLDVIRRYDGREGFRWESGPNRGGNAARNRLLELARGEYVQWLDADDTLAPGKAPRLAALLDEGYDMAFSGYELDRAGAREAVELPPLGDDLVAYFTATSVITMLPVHRREDLVAVGGFDERLECCQEYELHLRLARTRWKRVAKVDDPLCVKHAVGESVSSSDLRVFRRRIGVAEALHTDLSRAGELSGERRAAIAAVIYNSGRHLVREGDAAGGREAFALARRIGPPESFPITRAMRVLTGLLGPVRAEALRAKLVRAPINPSRTPG